MAYAFLFVIVLLVDQLSKALAAGLDFNNIQIIPSLLHLDFTLNTGMAFGMLGDKTWAQPLFIALTCVALVVFFILFIKLSKDRRFLRVALVLIMVGAAGNLIDRAVMQAVRDFILVSVGNIGFLNFNCNVADIAITVGAVMFVLALLFVDKDAVFRSKKNKEKQELLSAAEQLDESASEADNDLGSVSAEENKDTK